MSGRVTQLVRIAPPLGFGSRRSLRLIERNLLVYRHGWLVILSGFFEPLFYLFGIGFGLGGLVGSVQGPNGQALPYGVFVAPALLATAAMNGAVYESTFNLFFKLKWAKTYDAILSTPMGVGDVALGEVTWALIRGLLYATGFMVVLLALGLARTPLALLAVPAATLIGFAAAAIGMSATTFMRKWQDFDLITVVTMPLFLFSGTFFPIESLPGFLQPIAWLSPLWHGVDLARGLVLGTVIQHPAVMLAHVVILSAIVVIATWATVRNVERRLVQG